MHTFASQIIASVGEIIHTRESRKTAVVTHPFKKVKSHGECKNYRGFRLHNIVYKIYSSILNKPKQLSRKKSKKKKMDLSRDIRQ